MLPPPAPKPTSLTLIATISLTNNEYDEVRRTETSTELTHIHVNSTIKKGGIREGWRRRIKQSSPDSRSEGDAASPDFGHASEPVSTSLPEGSGGFKGSMRAIEERNHCLNHAALALSSKATTLDQDVVDLIEDSSDSDRDDLPSVRDKPKDPRPDIGPSSGNDNGSFAGTQIFSASYSPPASWTHKKKTLAPLVVLKRRRLSRNQHLFDKQHQMKPLSEREKQELTPVQSFLTEQWSNYHTQEDRKGGEANPIEL